MESSIKEAVKVLEQGGIVIFPTDTAFGIGCRIDDEKTVERLFSLRKRPITQATPVLFDTIERVREYVLSIPRDVETDLLEKYWPGALTVVLPARLDKVVSLIRGGGLGLGARIPAHEIPLMIISELGVPIIGTSANFSGGATPYKLSDIDPELISLVDLVVPGICSVQKASTVIDCTQSPWKILREGAVKVDVGGKS